MSRLADYFVVVGYDHEKERSGASSGKIIQRFPEKDWDDCPFTQGLDLFCQPGGWALSAERNQPTFFVSVLTDIDADRHYCACLTFNESLAITPSKPDDGDDQDTNLVRHSLMFAPKSISLISRVDYFEAFRNCLGIIYTVYVDSLPVQLETLVGNILGCVQVPRPGGPQVRFSIGAGDRQSLQPPLSPSLPVTNIGVAMLFDQLGIQNTICLFCALITDHKVLFHSESYSRLTEACNAISSLQYPLKYSYVYIPILPSPLLEVLTTPTPFLAGVHSKHQEVISELLDVIIVDLDGGSLRIPECIKVPELPEPILTRTRKALTMVLNVNLISSDYAFPSSPKRPSIPIHRDKEVRAVFLRLMAELFAGYRSCLTIIRIHPEPFISFHKANFLGHRSLVDDDFMARVLDGMAFGAFVAEKGPPYRICDIFDEVYATFQDQLQKEMDDPEKLREHIRELSHQLYLNENPNPQPYVQKFPKPTEGAYSRIHQPSFPYLDWIHVQEIIEEGLAKHSIKSKLANVRPHQPRIVPMGSPITSVMSKSKIVDNNARRLEVLRNCVNFIFDNKISDSRRIFSAVLRALKSRIVRLALTQEMSYHVQSNRAMLEHQQFDLVVRLLNCALQNDSSMDENGIAAAILPLATSFCRKLCTGVIQFAYTCVQEHAVWQNQAFWEATFYQDVQKQIRQLYLPQYEEHRDERVRYGGSKSPTFKEAELSVFNSRPSSTTPDMQRRVVGPKPREIGALDIAAEQLRLWPNMSKEEQEEFINKEESTVYSQAIHYANRMVFLRVPLDVSKSIKTGFDGESTSNSNVTASLAESDSFDAESGFDESEASDVGSTVIRFVTRFVDKVCGDGGVTQDHMKSLHQMIPGVVAMHIETLEAVHRESKRLPPIQKPKILSPVLLPGEEKLMDGLRVYLLPDGREEGTGTNLGGPYLLPAEGAIFLTTYRIIFKGTPTDPLACEQIVVRCIPISTLTKEKKLNVQYMSHLDQWLQDGLQIRSNIFQLMKIAFDEEVASDSIETFRILMKKARNPPTVFNTFTFTGHHIVPQTPLHSKKEKNASLKNFAKKTLMKTARKAGLRSKPTDRKQKYVLPTPPMNRKSIMSQASDTESERPNSEVCDDLSIIDETEFMTTLATDPKSLEKLMERPGYQDYERLGLGSLPATGSRSRTEPFRISIANANFSVCRSYPALLVVPQSVTDDSIRKFARSHRQYRFPVITWRHRRTKALLLRASSFHSRGVMGMLKHNPATSTSSGETTSSLEQEKYFSAVVQATPNSSRYNNSVSDSMTSIDSLIMVGTAEGLNLPDTPDTHRKASFTRSGLGQRTSAINKAKTATAMPLVTVEETPNTARRNMFARAVDSLRSSGGKTGASLGRLGSFRDKSRLSTASLDQSLRLPRQNGSVDHKGDIVNNSLRGLKSVALHILGEKAQLKGIKMDSFPKCDFTPIDFDEVRHVKASFKKLLRACVPSAVPSSTDHGFLRLIEESNWLQQVHNILKLAGVTVDLLDVQGSSVMICLEDGWDITTQIVTLAEVMLDPYYRTIEGFKALIEKEWLSFGHRFTHRSNQTAANQASGFAPVFLQFLDAVHQIHNQFPLSFEFNQYFIKFLAYHYVSNRFRTFMLDNEFERMDSGWILDERKGPKVDSGDDEGGFVKHLQQSNMGTSIWEYMDKHHRRSPLFYNFMYSPEDTQPVLRPYSNLANLKIWDYYVTEDLAHGPSYDIEVVTKELRLNEDVDITTGLPPQKRKIVNGCYDNVPLQEPDIYSWQLQEIHRLETDLGHLPQKWKVLWEKVDCPGRDSLHRQVSFNTQSVRSHGRTSHKQATMEVILKGKLARDQAQMFVGQPHRFEKHTYATFATCDYCGQVLWGLMTTGIQCVECGYNCHDKCKPHAPRICSKFKSISETSASNSSISKGGGSDNSSVSGGGTLTGSTAIYETYSSSIGENRTHEGYLYKRGALLKGWKQRWFVLDSMKHQLRYYDSMEDSSCKGFIDLADVISVAQVKNVQGAPKKSHDNTFFELKTLRRVYNFMATEGLLAQEWIDKVQGCIQ